MTALAALVLLTWAYLLLFHGRFWSAGPVLRASAVESYPPPAPRFQGGEKRWPSIDIVIPARDEAGSIEATLRSLLAQDYSGRFHITLVDDGSTDGTGAIARAIGDDRLTVIDGAPRPAGWSGKLWAVQQGVAQGRAEIVLLTDADIVHEPAHLSALVARLDTGLDMASEMVELRCTSLAERALVPAFVFFFQLLYPFARVNDPRHRTAAAAGGVVLLRRAALDRIGGIASLGGALIDDVALASRLKPHGPIWLGHAALARSVRPYPGAADIWRMVARTAYVQLRFSPLLLGGTVLGLMLVWLAPPALALFATGPARWMGALAWLGSALSYLPTLHRFRQSPAWALALPGIAVFYLAATIGSAVDHHRGRGVRWKNRAYRDAGGGAGA